MKNKKTTNELIKEKYSTIARQSREQNASSCCGSGNSSKELCNIMADEYTGLEGYHADADLGLGCGLPTEFAKIKQGDTVVDLGAGAGNDCFVARSIAGDSGKIIGIDMTEAMIDKASANAKKLGFNNVEFRSGDIEKIPLSANQADVVISNCVLNLVPDKKQAFSEIFRVLKPGGHFSISDVVLSGELPPKIKKASEMYVGCVAGALQKEEYLDIIKKLGFSNITIQKEKKITIPDDILASYLDEEEIKVLKENRTGVLSITVYAEKPKTCCDSSCCN